MQFWIVSLLALTGTSLAAPTYSYASSSSSSSAYHTEATPATYGNEYENNDGDDHHDKKDVSINVILAGGHKTVTTPFENAGQWREEKQLEYHGPFSTVELALGADFERQTLRCQILDKHYQPIVVVRGENIDTTFSDADKGLWTFRDGEREVSAVVCNPAFAAEPQPPPVDGGNGKDTSVVVRLSGASELATQTPFVSVGGHGGSEILPPVASSGPFDSVTLTLGKDVDQALRCRLTDQNGRVITLKRGESIQNTFAMGNPWTFLHPAESEVGSIECNEKFVLGSP